MFLALSNYIYWMFFAFCCYPNPLLHIIIPFSPITHSCCVGERILYLEPDRQEFKFLILPHSKGIIWGSYLTIWVSLRMFIYKMGIRWLNKNHGARWIWVFFFFPFCVFFISALILICFKVMIPCLFLDIIPTWLFRFRFSYISWNLHLSWSDPLISFIQWPM